MSESYPLPEELLSKEFLSKYENKNPKWGFDGLGYVIFKRTYARKIEDKDRTEEWNETIARCIIGAQKIGAKYTKEEAERLYDLMFNLKCSFSGRSLWQLGTRTLDIVGMDSLLNCWVTKISNINDFVFVFMESMLGGGVGCNIAKEWTHELPRVKKGVRCKLKNTKDADFIVPDSKEGWAELWRRILEAYLITGKSFTYSTVCIRSSGEPLKTFGGIAPGPKPLVDGAELLCKVLNSREGKKLRTDDIADIICIGGAIVKSGGIRRTALILGGDVDDMSYLNLKRWDLGILPSYRSNSNNSLLCSNFSHLSDKFWDGYNGNGEPYGLINLKTSKKYGRLGEEEIDGFILEDESIEMVNPCAEATLGDKESCNLAELFLNNIKSKEEMLDCARLLYKAQKAIAAGNYLHEETNEIVHKNMRLGLGVTGIAQSLNVVEEWCDFVYKGLRKFDKEWSKKNNYPQSIRLTVIKPSGTLSLLPGSTPGVHPGFAKHHIRRVRFSSNDPLLPKLKESGYRMEPEIQLDRSINHDITIVSFPANFSEETLCAKECTAIKQLELVKKLQEKWADQAVSVTVYYSKDELGDIKKWLKDNYNNSVKTVSFLLRENHGFTQAPLEEITKEQYEEYKKEIKLFEYGISSSNEMLDAFECESGACPVR